jgi:hypothetical protein
VFEPEFPVLFRSNLFYPPGKIVDHIFGYMGGSGCGSRIVTGQEKMVKILINLERDVLPVKQAVLP